MSETTDPKVLLGHHLKKLKLPTILAEYDKQARLCAEQGISCDIEMLDINDINEGFERMEKGDVRYRFVIDMATLKNA